MEKLKEMVMAPDPVAHFLTSVRVVTLTMGLMRTNRQMILTPLLKQ